MIDQRDVPPIFKDEATRDNPGKYGSKKISPRKLAKMIRKHEKWDSSKEVVLYSCETGKGGKNSFPQKLADELGVGVWAPTDAPEFYDNLAGMGASISNGGTFEYFPPKPKR